MLFTGEDAALRWIGQKPEREHSLVRTWVKDAEERVQVIKENLKIAQMRQKSYHDQGTAPRHFEVGDYVYFKVSPTKGVQRFGVKGKLAPR
jgi:hypothetical protein